MYLLFFVCVSPFLYNFFTLSLQCLQTMQTVNKKMDPQKTLKTMQDFQKENMKMGMTEEMSEDTHMHIYNELWYSLSYITRLPGCV